MPKTNKNIQANHSKLAINIPELYAAPKLAIKKEGPILVPHIDIPILAKPTLLSPTNKLAFFACRIETNRPIAKRRNT